MGGRLRPGTRIASWLLAGGSLAVAHLGAAPPAATEAAGSAPYLIVLGIAQDGGFPQAGTKDHPGWTDPAARRLVASLGLVDPASGERWLFDATPDFPAQLQRLDRAAPHPGRPGLAGIFLTHAHMGHYAGLLHLGREAMGADAVPVWAMPRMAAFLRGNGPWDLLVTAGHVELRELAAGREVRLNDRLAVTPLLVPHRDEYSETVAFVVAGPERRALFLPDIDKWERWDAAGTRIEDVLARVDAAYLDGTFFADGEIPGRAMHEIPHPFVSESLARFGSLPLEERGKIRFVHLNRTNPLLLAPDGPAAAAVRAAGMGIAAEGERFGL